MVLEMQVASRATEMIPRWQTTLKDITDYARSRGIGIWLYVNQRALATQLDTILPIYERLGIKGVKFGFVQVGSQGWTTWLHNAVRKCAEHHLMVDIHDEYRPTGVSRTVAQSDNARRYWRQRRNARCQTQYRVALHAFPLRTC